MPSESPFSQLGNEEQKRLLKKLAKLKALSECKTGNVNETASAAARMTRIMLEYQIEMFDLEESSEQELVEQAALPDSYNGFPNWKGSLLLALAEVNSCLCYTRSLREVHLNKRRTRSRLCLVGAPGDVQNTRQLFAFCVDETERLCREWGRCQTVKRRNDFKKGAACGIAEKVRSEKAAILRDEEQRASAMKSTSLALAMFERKEDAVAEYAAKLGVRTVTRRVRPPSQRAYAAGYQAGLDMDLKADLRPPLDE